MQPTFSEWLVFHGLVAFEPRNQGDSDRMPGYDPLQWLTDYEVEDTRAALRSSGARATLPSAVVNETIPPASVSHT